MTVGNITEQQLQSGTLPAFEPDNAASTSEKVQNLRKRTRLEFSSSSETFRLMDDDCNNNNISNRAVDLSSFKLQEIDQESHVSPLTLNLVFDLESPEISKEEDFHAALQGASQTLDRNGLTNQEYAHACLTIAYCLRKLASGSASKLDSARERLESAIEKGLEYADTSDLIRAYLFYEEAMLHFNLGQLNLALESLWNGMKLCGQENKLKVKFLFNTGLVQSIVAKNYREMASHLPGRAGTKNKQVIQEASAGFEEQAIVKAMSAFGEILTIFEAETKKKSQPDQLLKMTFLEKMLSGAEILPVEQEKFLALTLIGLAANGHAAVVYDAIQGNSTLEELQSQIEKAEMLCQTALTIENISEDVKACIHLVHGNLLEETGVLCRKETEYRPQAFEHYRKGLCYPHISMKTRSELLCSSDRVLSKKWLHRN